VAREILIADSHKVDQGKYQKIFEMTDYHLIFSESGEDVLLRVKLFKPDLIMAGTALSDKNGFQLCEALKGDPEFRSIPFILLLDDFEKISEEEKKRLKPDGILAKPLREGEVLNMVDRLLEGMRVEGKGISGKDTRAESFANMNKEDFSLDGSGESGEGEVIDLLDVVEESEPRMSINDFAIPAKEEALGEIASLETWGKMEGEEKLGAEDEIGLSLKEKEAAKAEPTLQPRKEVPPGEVSRKEAPPGKPLQDEELFEKIELEDILEKMGQMDLPSEIELPLERKVRVLKAPPSTAELPEEKSLNLEEFETLLKKGVEAEVPEGGPLEEALQPLSSEEEKVEVPEEITPIEIPEEELEGLEKFAEEAFPKGLLEEALKEEKVEAIESLEEELKGLEEEEIEGLEEEELEVIEELEEVEELKEEKIDLFEELEASEALREAMPIVEEPKPIKKPLDVEARRFFEEAVGVSSRRMDQRMDEILTARIRGMMEEFITKHVPEMTKDLVGLTIERIEKMVKEIVPDLAEKMIEEEIKRLERGEKA
jgi:CheY-like chemotaxis protein